MTLNPTKSIRCSNCSCLSVHGFWYHLSNPAYATLLLLLNVGKKKRLLSLEKRNAIQLPFAVSLCFISFPGQMFTYVLHQLQSHSTWTQLSLLAFEVCWPRNEKCHQLAPAAYLLSAAGSASLVHTLVSSLPSVDDLWLPGLRVIHQQPSSER